MKPLVTITKRASSGNVCDLHFFAPSGNTVPTRVQWENFPPSAEDVAEAETFVCRFLNAEGVNITEPLSVVDNSITTEDLVRRLNSAGVN